MVSLRTLAVRQFYAIPLNDSEVIEILSSLVENRNHWVHASMLLEVTRQSPILKW